MTQRNAWVCPRCGAGNRARDRACWSCEKGQTKGPAVKIPKATVRRKTAPHG